MRTPLLLLPVAALALPIAGCGDKVVKQSSEEDLVKKSLAGAGNEGQEKKIDCPDDVKAKNGTTFTCHVTLKDGRKGDFVIKVGKVSGDKVDLKVVNVKQVGG